MVVKKRTPFHPPLTPSLTLPAFFLPSLFRLYSSHFGFPSGFFEFIFFFRSLQVFSLHSSHSVLHTLRIPFGWSFSIFLPCCIKLVFVNVGGYVVVLLPFYNTQQTLAFKPKNNQKKNLVVALNYLADSMTGVYIENKEIYTHEWRMNERRERENGRCVFIFSQVISPVHRINQCISFCIRAFSIEFKCDLSCIFCVHLCSCNAMWAGRAGQNEAIFAALSSIRFRMT